MKKFLSLSILGALLTFNTFLGANITQAQSDARLCMSNPNATILSTKIENTPLNETNTYKNDEFGFSLKFPKTWTQLKVFTQIKEVSSHSEDGSTPTKQKLTSIHFTLPSVDYDGECYDSLFIVTPYTESQKKFMENYLKFPTYYPLGQNNQYIFAASLANGLWGLDEIDNTSRWYEITPKILPTFTSWDLPVLN